MAGIITYGHSCFATVKTRSRWVFNILCLSTVLLFAACTGGTDDLALIANVKSQLASQSRVLASEVNVEAKDGVVTLSGTVDNEEAKIQAEQTVKSLPAVRSVINNLSVKRL